MISALCAIPVALVASFADNLSVTTKPGRPLTIVAIGTSNTQGHWKYPQDSYPAKLQSFIPNSVVYNKGKGGEEAAGALSRFDTDVLAYDPDLVIWELGTTDASAHRPLGGFRATIEQGLAKLQGIPVLFLGPQAATAPNRDDAAYEAVIDRFGRPNWSRIRAMKIWAARGVTGMIAEDGVHTSSWVSDCMAENLAAYIVSKLHPLKTKASADTRD